MINAVPNQPANYSKAPEGAAPAASAAPAAATSSGSSMPPKKKNNKLFGIDRRAVFTVLGLASFLVLAMAGVYIALLQRFDEGPVAPTAPESRPQAAQETPNKCTAEFIVPSDMIGNAQVNCTFFSGFACIPRNADFPVKVEVYEGGQYRQGGVKVAEGRANVARGESITSRCGSEEHGFRVEVPSTYLDGTTKEAYIYAVDPDSRERILIQGSPVSLDTATCAEETPEEALSCTKETYQDEFSNTAGTYQLLTQDDTFAAGDTVVFAINITANNVTDTITLTDVVPSNMTFVDSNCGANAYSSTNNTLTCTGEDRAIFRATVNDTVADGTTITNTANVEAGTLSDECTTDIVVSVDEEEEEEPEVLSCGDSCSPGSTTAECPEDHTCTTDTNTCVFNPCLEDGVSCTENQCVLESDEEETPSAFCRDACTTNADCSESDHICWNGECRLATNPNSTTCSTPSTTTTTTVTGQDDEPTTPRQTTTTTTTTTPGETQPVLPEELPETGVLDDGLRVLGAGFAALTLGGLLLLLL